jgi:hypothetical protein
LLGAAGEVRWEINGENRVWEHGITCVHQANASPKSRLSS